MVSYFWKYNILYQFGKILIISYISWREKQTFLLHLELPEISKEKNLIPHTFMLLGEFNLCFLSYIVLRENAHLYLPN
jgi:hypothetical protein